MSLDKFVSSISRFSSWDKELEVMAPFSADSRRLDVR